MRIMTLALAPLGSLALILMLIGFVHDPPSGLPVQIAYYRYQEETCEDGRTVVVRVLANGKVNLFNRGVQEIQGTELANRLEEIFRTRAERIVFIEAEPDLPLSAVADVIDISRSQVNLVAILTSADETGYCVSIYHHSQGLL